MDKNQVALMPHTYKLGDHQVVTMLRPMGSLSFNGVKNKETNGKTVQLIIGDICGPTLYANFSVEDAKSLSKNILGIIEKLEATE